MAGTRIDNRPSPEVLLEQVAKEGRGRLKIFLRAAPGVGKSYEMLTQARHRRLDGVDVAIGVAMKRRCRYWRTMRKMATTTN
jgi:two-component system sensor histidine kinase KdpD